MKYKKIAEKIEVMANNVLVYIELPSNETDAGLIISDAVAESMKKEITGEVVAVGKECKNFKVGDTLLLPPHGSSVVAYKEHVFHVFRETSLFAKLKK
jgi:co-chaperonin GroES (HSP10)